MKRILSIIALMAMTLGLSAQTINVKKAKAKKLHHTWSVGTCAGRVAEGLRTSWVEQLRLSHDMGGFQYLRMHDLFNDEMCIYNEKPNGKVVYNWQYVDEVYDRMLQIGVRPFVELSFFPKGIDKDDGKLQMWYQNRVTPDTAKYGKWAALVTEFCKHCINRYGIDEVQTWYFECWNEPNLDFGFFDGTKSEYFLLYKYTAEAVKAASPLLRVGGPATSNFIADARHEGERTDNQKSYFYEDDVINKQQWKGVWIEEFLRYCEHNNLPLDFVSCHAYPTDYALDPVTRHGRGAVRYVHSLRDDLNWLKKTIKASKYPNAEMHITEWSTSPNSRDGMHDLLPPAAYIIKANLECEGMVNSIQYWTFTDIFEEKGGGEEIYHGGFGMINFQGIVKPSFHAYRMLHQLGDESIYNTDPFVWTRSSETGLYSGILYNYPAEYENHVPHQGNCGNYMQASAKTVAYTIKGLRPGAEFLFEQLDKDHGNAYDEWVCMGKPHSPTREQTAILKASGWNTEKRNVKADDEGVLTINENILPWTCILITEK